jgi:hypothetical protein
MSEQAIQKLEIPKVNTPDASEFGVMRETATMLVKTGFLPQSINTPEKAIAIILTGRELGIGTMAALNTINVISGKPTVSPQLMLALIERSGQLEDIQIVNEDSHVRCTMKRRGRSPHTEFFGDAEATAMQLKGKDNYKKQAFTMYKWRAVAACARVVFPDVISGLYTPDEMGADVTEDGELLPPVQDNIRPLPAKTKKPAFIPEARAAGEGELNDDTLAAIVDQDERLSDLSEIKTLCKDLIAAGDDVPWMTKQILCDYAGQLFNLDVKSNDDLTNDQVRALKEDLQERLDALR